MEYIILGKGRGRRLKYLPRGTLEVCSSKRSEILMDYGMIGPLGLPDIFRGFLVNSLLWYRSDLVGTFFVPL